MTLFVALNKLREEQDPTPSVRLCLPCCHLRVMWNVGERKTNTRLQNTDQRLTGDHHTTAAASV